MRYIKSKFLQVIENEEKYFVFHSLFNNPVILDKSIIEFIDLFNIPKSLKELNSTIEGDVDAVVNELIDLNFLIENGKNERTLLQNIQQQFLTNLISGKELVRLELAISNSCNFGCKHCMHFINNSFQDLTYKEMNMSIETAKSSIDTFIQLIKKHENNNVRIHFGNGEPLINWNTIKYCLEYCSSIDNVGFSFAINTNLSLLDKKKALILKKYNVKISTSLDGIEKANDLIRVYQNGKGTFQTILKKIQLLKEIEYPIDGFSITVTDKNFPFIDTSIIDFGKEIGVKDISMDYDLVNTTLIPIKECVDKIIKLRKYANSIGMNFYGTWETPYRVLTTNSWLEKPHAFCPAFEGKTLEFNVDGSIKVCGHTNTKIGHQESINTLFDMGSSYMNLIKSRLPGNNEYCIDCKLEGSCAGQCHVTVEASIQNKRLFENMCQLMKLTTVALISEQLREDDK